MSSFLRNMVIGGCVAGALAASVATPAVARDGGAIAAGVVGGLALGAIAGSAAANSNYGYAPTPAYGAYGAPAPYYGGGCYFTRQPVYDQYGEVIGRRRVRVCE